LEYAAQQPLIVRECAKRRDANLRWHYFTRAGNLMAKRGQYRDEASEKWSEAVMLFNIKTRPRDTIQSVALRRGQIVERVKEDHAFLQAFWVTAKWGESSKARAVRQTCVEQTSTDPMAWAFGLHRRSSRVLNDLSSDSDFSSDSGDEESGNDEGNVARKVPRISTGVELEEAGGSVVHIRIGVAPVVLVGSDYPGPVKATPQHVNRALEVTQRPLHHPPIGRMSPHHHRFARRARVAQSRLPEYAGWRPR
jgi:hypothetical protein